MSSAWHESPLLELGAPTSKTFPNSSWFHFRTSLPLFLFLPSHTPPQSNSSSEPTHFRITCAARATQGLGLLTNLKGIKLSRPREGGKPNPRLLPWTAGAREPELSSQMPIWLSRQDTLTSGLTTSFPFWYLLPSSAKPYGLRTAWGQSHQTQPAAKSRLPQATTEAIL